MTRAYLSYVGIVCTRQEPLVACPKFWYSETTFRSKASNWSCSRPVSVSLGKGWRWCVVIAWPSMISRILWVLVPHFKHLQPICLSWFRLFRHKHIIAWPSTTRSIPFVSSPRTNGIRGLMPTTCDRRSMSQRECPVVENSVIFWFWRFNSTEEFV